MILHIYQLITVFIAALVVAVMLRERKLSRQLLGGVVLVLLILRILLIK